jgi:hypothetical protein
VEDVTHAGGSPGAPIYVNVDVWNEVEDITEELQKLESDGGFA